MNNTSFISRRKFIKLLGGAVLAMELGDWSAAEAAVKKAADPATAQPSRDTRHVVRGLRGNIDIDYIRQIITADPAVSRTIMWQSDELLSGAVVEYRPAGAARSLSQPASYDFFTGDDSSFYIYSVQLTSLTPQQDYEYRIVCGRYGTDWITMRTAGRGSFKALLFTDSQCSENYSCWHEIVQLAALRHPDAQFWINLGDLVDNGQQQCQWRGWFDAARGFLEHTPLVPVMGNHEAYSLDWQYCLPRDYLHEFTLPDNGSQRFPGYYFSFDYGPVHFTVLNTQFEELDDLRPGLLDEEIRWLQKDVHGSARQWKIVLMHRDIFTYEPAASTTQGTFSDIGQTFMPLFDRLGIDLVLSGHLHTYRNRGHIYNFKPSSRGPLYIVCGLAGNCRYPDIWVDPVFDKKIAPQPETDNYLTLEASTKQLSLRCFLPNGDEIDKAVLQKG